jgi:hypothetical protein
MSMRTLATLSVGAAAVLATSGSITPAADGGVPTKAIANATSVDYRAVVTARRRSSGSAPTAAVTVTTYGRQSGRWVLLRTRPLPETYFWKTVTAPRALCRLEISTAASGRGRAPRLVVELLLSPSLGCGRTFVIPLVAP